MSRFKAMWGEGDVEMMDDMEIEEGEAYSYHNNNYSSVDDKYDDGIDPDVAFSYMDVKIRDVLGHFQKDFEGGVSAENLGAKFGGYGSFLPTCPRSPLCSQSRRSSPIPSPLEGPPPDGGVSMFASETQRHGSVHSSNAAVSRSKRRSFDSSKQEKCMPPLRAVEDENSYESANRKSSSSVPDQKMLKVRIKLSSSDNLSTQNKAAIYSGLGLDASPSSSLGESPTQIEGMSCGFTTMGSDSPTSILQIMTSCPLNGEPLLSPLPDNLVDFIENKKKKVEGQKGKKLLKEKTSELMERKEASVGLKGSSSKKSKRKELDIDSLGCEDLISRTLELPIISGAEGNSSHRRKEDLSHPVRKVSEVEREALDAPGEKSALSADGASLRGKKKLNKSQNKRIQLADLVKEDLRDSSTMSKKSIREDNSRAMSENDEIKSKKVVEKGGDIYRDFFGEIEQEEDNNAKLKEGVGDKMIEKVPTSEGHVDAAPPASIEPIVIEENWVCCDKCGKWRLLPVGKDPKSLPEKWLCSMLDWLPGKNRCSVSEPETNAVLAQSYALAPTSQSSAPLNSEILDPSYAATGGNPNENRPNRTPQAPSVVAKKKHGMKQVIHPSVAGRPSDSEQTIKSKQRSYDRHSDRVDDDTLRLSKKVRNRDVQSGDEDRGSSGSRRLGKNGKSNEQAPLSQPDSARNIPMKQQAELLEKVKSHSENSLLKKRNRERASEVHTRDSDEHRKGKKARVSNNEGKESTEMKSTRKVAKDPQPSLGPTSNRSKASEVKGSPAESVSNSPMRSSKPDMLASAVKNVVDCSEKEKGRSFKYEGEGYKRKASDGEAKPRDSERKRSEDELEKKDFVGNDEKPSRRDDTQVKKSKALNPDGASQTKAPRVSTKQAVSPIEVNKALKPSEKAVTGSGTRVPSDRRESYTQAAANALKEAKDLKHMADRVKASGSNLEGTGLYFQAALKFLHGASLLESSFNASSKYSEMIQSQQTYISTAKLCEFCAHEYEKSDDMASAALAYKCMEVAYLKVVYSNQNNVSRDRQELQIALKLVPPGESPSSSVSDLDHVNNTEAVENKATLPKDETHPQVAGNHLISARNRPNFERLLNFAQDVNNAMEASRRSMAAFSTASSKSGDAQYKEVISSVKRAMDFNFQDVEGLLKLVRVATEAIGR